MSFQLDVLLHFRLFYILVYSYFYLTYKFQETLEINMGDFRLYSKYRFEKVISKRTPQCVTEMLTPYQCN